MSMEILINRIAAYMKYNKKGLPGGGINSRKNSILIWEWLTCLAQKVQKKVVLHLSRIPIENKSNDKEKNESDYVSV